MSISTSTDFGITTLNQPSGDGVCQSGERIGVRGVRHDFTDAQREQAIQRAGRALERHVAEWERSGCFAARGDADRARRLMEQLIAGRSAEQVARMEQERGLA